MRTGPAKVAAATVLVGLVLALLGLYVLPWWPSDHVVTSFPAMARALMTAYRDPQARPFAATALAYSFFGWGHLVFSGALVVAAVAFVASIRWFAVGAGAVAAAATGWMLYACLNAGLINMQFSAYLPYLGAALVVVPALLSTMLRAAG